MSKVVDIPVLGDESGLVVPALNGEPGVYSARYAGEVHNNVANIQLLLRKMENITDREAYMQTVLVLMYPDGQYYYGEGSARGSITRSRRGFNGFGYDSVFYSPQLKRLLPKRPLSKSNRSAIVCRRSTICSEKSTKTLAR